MLEERTGGRLTSKEAQAVADMLAAREGFPPVKVLLGVEAKRGRAYYRHSIITVPEWAQAQGRPFALAYLLHEIAHFCAKGRGHDAVFHAVEDRLVGEWGWTIVRRPGKVGYVKALLDRSGNIVWHMSEERKRARQHSLELDDVLKGLAEGGASLD